MIAAFIGCVLFLCFVFLHPRFERHKPLVSSLGKIVIQDDSQSKTNDRQAFSSYETIIAKRQLFVLTSGNTLTSENIAAVKAVSTWAQVVKNFSLVGILPGDNPQAIIEDKSKGKTYYVGKTQDFEGVTVKDIKDKVVVLEYNGENHTLNL